MTDKKSEKNETLRDPNEPDAKKELRKGHEPDVCKEIGPEKRELTKLENMSSIKEIERNKQLT